MGPPAPPAASYGSNASSTTERTAAPPQNGENSQQTNGQSASQIETRNREALNAAVDARDRQVAEQQKVPAYTGSVQHTNPRTSLLKDGSYSYAVVENGVRSIRTIRLRDPREYVNPDGSYNEPLLERDLKSVADNLAINQTSASAAGALAYNNSIRDSDMKKKVKLVPISSRQASRVDAQGNGVFIDGTVEFDIAPDMTEERQVSYIPISEIRTPGSLHIYMGTNGRTFTINAKLVSTNDEQALENIRKINALKAMAMPEKGYTGVLGDDGPPIPVRLYGYGKRLQGIPCVLTSLSIPYPEDVDYFYTSVGGVDTGIPIVNTISISLQEIRSTDELLTTFDIQSFREGTLKGW